jgi:hypothetical protein
LQYRREKRDSDEMLPCFLLQGKTICKYKHPETNSSA